ncbi:MAG: MFS transporter [Micrococcales bacterium]|nr:MFS transporter [Micrococcales bacterium]
MNSKRIGVFTLGALIFISLILRPPVAAIGPLVPELTSRDGLSLLQVGVLTSISVVCFGLGAFAGPWLVKLLGLDKAMMAVLLALTGSMALRLVGGFPLLLSCTVVIGLAIAIGNVLIPTVVREQFPKKIELITGIYVTLLAISASLAATIAVPVSDWSGSWRGSLGIWLIPAVLAIIFWWPVAAIKKAKSKITSETHAAERKAVLKSPITWAIVGFFGFQSTGFYAVLNWLPSLLHERGLSEVDAGALLGLTTFVGVPAAFLISLVIKRLKSLSLISVIVSGLTLTGLSIIWFSHEYVVLGCIVMGFGFAATFPLSLTMIGTRASTASQTTQLSALSQGWGYLIAATGTFLFGELRRSTGSWDVSLLMLAIMTLVQIYAGYLAGRNRYIPAE